MSDGSVSQAEAGAAAAAPEPGPARTAPSRTQSSDAPWHNPVPAHDGPADEAKAASDERAAEPAEPSDGPAEPSDGTAAGERKTSEPPAGSAGQDGDGA